MIRWHDLGVALALVLVIEGMLPFLNPAALRNAMQTLIARSDRQLRYAGLASMALGLVLLYAI